MSFQVVIVTPEQQVLDETVEGGIAQMKNNKLTILTQIAIPADQINVETARAELAEATARRATDEAAIADRQKRMQRARAMQALATAR